MALARNPSLLAAAGLVLGACDGQGLSQAWQLDRLRVLAVRAEPAEPRPGDTVSLQALYYVPPHQQLELSVWFACLPESADEYGCEVDSRALDALEELDLEKLSPEELAALYDKLAAAGLIGVEPILPPTWQIPSDALDELTEEERLEGLSAVVNITALPAGAQSEADSELAYKRVPVSEAATPNHNPDLAGLLVDGLPAEPGATVRASWGQELLLEPVLAADAIETYVYRTQEGTDEERLEEPYLTWYTEAGEFDQSYSLYPSTQVTWRAPASQEASATDSAQVRIISVIRDRRGGMGWVELLVELGD